MVHAAQKLCPQLSKRGGPMMTQFKIHPEVRTTPGDEDGSVLINLQSGKVFSLNGVGAQVWTMLERQVAYEDVLDSLALDYEVPREQLQDDLEAFLHELECHNLVSNTAANIH
jgi:hypothetical protein